MNYYFLVALAVLFWSGNFVVGRYVSSDIAPIDLAFFRWLSVLCLMLPYILYKHKRIFFYIKNYPLIIFVQALIGIAGFNTLLYYGLQTTTATNALLINSIIPIIIVFLSFFILSTKITKKQTLGIVISTLGVIYIVLKGDINNIINLEFTKGDFWIIMACFDWALYSIFLKFIPKDIKPFEFFTSTILIGTFILFILNMFLSDSFESLYFLQNDDVVYALIYIVIFPSILSFYFWNISTKALSANITGQFTHLMPVFGSVIAYFLLGEVLNLYHFIGIIFIATGIYLTSFAKKI